MGEPQNGAEKSPRHGSRSRPSAWALALVAALIAMCASAGAGIVGALPAASAAPRAAGWGLTSFCTPSQDFPESRRFRVTNNTGAMTTVTLRNQNSGATVQHSAPPGQSFVLVPAAADPNAANTTQLIVEGVTVATKAANNKACSSLEGDAVCVPGTGAFTVTWKLRNNGTGPSTVTSVSIPGLVLTPNPVPPNVVASATETVGAPASGSVTRPLTVGVDLGSGITETLTSTVVLGKCEGPVASFTFTKSASVETAGVGDVITYTYAGTNTGAVDLEVTQLVDDRLGIVIQEPEVTIVPPGGSLTREVPYTVTAQDAALGRIDNAAVVTVLPVGATDSLSAVADASVSVLPDPPAPDALAGSATCDPVTSTYTIEWVLFNGGPGDAVIADSNRALTFSPEVIGEGSIATATETVPSPADTEVITLELDIAAAPDAPAPRPPASLSADVTIGRCIGQVSFTFTKTPDVASARVGDVVTYTYAGTNTGTVPLLIDQLVDDRLGVVIDDDPDLLPLPPGESISRSVQYVVTAEDASLGEIDNAAVVTGSRGDVEGADQLSAVALARVVIEPIPEGTDPDTPGPELAPTGSDSWPLLVLGMLTVIAGAAVSRVARSRSGARATGTSTR